MGVRNAGIVVAGSVAAFTSTSRVATLERICSSRMNLSDLTKTRQWLLALDAFAIASAGQSVTLPALIGSKRTPETGGRAA
jgi:hypothetical protein